MLPFSLGAAMSSAIGGMIITRTGQYRPVVWTAWAVMTLGFGLMFQLSNTSSLAEQVVYPLITAVGVGLLFQGPLIALQAAMPLKDMATSTATFGFIRQLGGTLGLSIGQTIWSTTLRKKLALIPNLPISTSSASLGQNVRQLKNIPDPVTRQAVMHAYARSISDIWLVDIPICAVGLIMILFIRNYSLKRAVVRQGAVGDDVEKGFSEDGPTEESVEAAQDDEKAKAESTRDDVAKEKIEDDVTETRSSIAKEETEEA